MPSTDDALKPERAQTDESLRNERNHTDRELSAHLRVIEADTAQLVENARESVDAALTAARATADQKPQAGSDPRVEAAREAEDADLERKRADTDEKLRGQTDYIEALLRLLPAEREKTDQHLLSERKHADLAIAHRDDFLGIVSHDLRSLLATVSLGAQLIERGDPSSIRVAQRIRRSAQHMSRLIGDLVDISAIEAGRLTITPTEVDATALVADVVQTFQHAAAAKSVLLLPGRVEAELVGALDRDRTVQVFANLIGNAIKFTPAGGTIQVGAQRAKGELRFSVADDGPGIPPEQREAVFERFWQVGENDRRGLGLGLYIARSIVEAQGGRIWAESALGEGSTFFFTVAAVGGHVGPSTIRASGS